jgi:hypothetical protein
MTDYHFSVVFPDAKEDYMPKLDKFADGQGLKPEVERYEGKISYRFTFDTFEEQRKFEKQLDREFPYLLK